MSREIATGRTLDYSRDKQSGRYFYRISYCTYRRYQYATAKAPGQCLEHGGETSYRRCSHCPDHERLGHEWHVVEPVLRVELCMTGDFRHNASSVCLGCTQRLICLSAQIQRLSRTKKRRVRLQLYEEK